ncbi:Uncharacterized protein HZ326_21882 [Fusarium oxysporum f. sp. albedinis]|nr:L-threo-3-deoxy-hexylosonate aldolase [Fusarium oxysporum f. sp. albedinis]KAJ0135073.1 Uncharacterized protein HZ326_21882 [Fusarium oxysporum f. sp. albedinis]
MGRRRIEIKKIIDQRARRATFGKRKSGLFKKAWEFGVLTGSKVYVVIEDERKTQYSFATNKEDLYLKYHDIDPENRVAPQDFGESAESPETLTSATGAIVGATRQQPQTQMSNNNDIEELPDAFSSDSLLLFTTRYPMLLTDFGFIHRSEYAQYRWGCARYRPSRHFFTQRARAILPSNLWLGFSTII